MHQPLLLSPLVLCAALGAGAACAAGPEAFLEQYARQATAADPGFTGFSAQRGAAFYLRPHQVDEMGSVSCASCHQPDPRKSSEAHHDQIPCRACHVVFSGQPEGHRPTRRELQALAPSANPERFTNEWRTEYWFAYNCKLLLGRECTAQEKGDLITWLLSVK
jgi:cytochrome c peroxidase